MFDLEWTGRSYGGDADRTRAIEAAEWFAANNNLDPAKCYAAFCDDADSEAALHWLQIEMAAYDALTEGWNSKPDNVSLVWL